MNNTQHDEQHMPYEGAGFLLSYKDTVLLGIRRKKAADAAKDPTVELEYMGGKVDAQDNNDPAHTAFSELVEEVGKNVLDSNWRTRALPTHVYQPFSKKWIWCFRLELNDAEFTRLVEASRALASWPNDETRIFADVTRRTTPCTKALETIVAVPRSDFVRYLDTFRAVPASANRLNDAKAFRVGNHLTGHCIDNGLVVQHPLRAFNAIVFEHNQ